MHAEPDDQLTPEERRIADHLRTSRPLPGAGFRGALGRYLAARDPGYGPRPERLRLLAGAWLLGGLALVAVGALLALGSL